jgi:Ca-activated chloride channel homolog
MHRFFTVTAVTMTLGLGVAHAGPQQGGGSLDKEAIRAVVRAHIGEVRECYDAALTQDPGARGKIVVDFTIAASGAVKQSKLASSDMSPQLGECVAQKISAWRFPAPAGGELTVSYPFAFEPG